MNIMAVIVDLRRRRKMGTIDQEGIMRRFLDMGYPEDDAARLTRIVLETECMVLALTAQELSKLLGICAKELIPQIYHNAVDTGLLSLMTKISDVLVADIENNGKKEIPG